MRIGAISWKNGALRWPVIALFIIWLIFAISSFFVVNKPFDAELVQDLARTLKSVAFSPGAVARALLDIGATSWITLAATGVGLHLYRRVIAVDADALQALLFSAALGFGALGLLSLGFGFVGLLSRSLWLGVLALLTILTVPGTLKLARKLKLGRPPAPIVAYLFFALGMALCLALLPPTSWDALFYHLKGPKLYIQVGAIRPGVDIPHLNFPSLFEMLFLLAMQIRGDVAARLIHLVFAFLLGGAVTLFSTRSLGLKKPWLPLMFLYSTPLVLILATWAYNDLALAFYALAALFALWRWDESGNQRWLLLGGILSGLLMGLKYTSIVIVAFMAIAILWRRGWRLYNSLRPLSIFAAAAAVLVLPWLLKNWLFTGNPVYPFLFGGQFWDGFRAAAYSDAGTGIGLDPGALLRLPYDMTLGYADASQEGTIGPSYLLYLPLFLFYSATGAARRMPTACKLLLAYALFSFLFWTFGVINSAALWQARLLLPGVVALCPVMAWITEDLSRYDSAHFSSRRFLGLVLIFVTSLLLLAQFSSWLQINPLAHLSGNETRAEYLFRRLGAHYQAIQAINTHLEEDAVVQFLWEPRSFYCDIDCRPDSILDRFQHQATLYTGAGALAEAWRNEGLTHVLIFETGLHFMLTTGEDIDEDLLWTLRSEHLMETKRIGNAYTLYRLK